MGDWQAVKAANIIHSYIEERPGQVRGEPWFAPILASILSASRSVEAEQLSLEVQACLSVLYQSRTGTMGKWQGHETGGVDSRGNRIHKLSPASVQEIPAGDNITVVDPKRPGNQFAPFIDKVVQWASAAIGISSVKVGKDYSKGTFTSLRMGDLDDRRNLEPIQMLIVDDIIKPIYDDFCTGLIMTGKIILPQYFNYKTLYTQATFTPQPPDFINPLQEAAAEREQLKSRTMTFKSKFDAEGKEWKEQFRQAAAEQAYADEIGLDLTALYGSAPTQIQVAGDMKQGGQNNGVAQKITVDENGEEV
jgi:capsid protein